MQSSDEFSNVLDIYRWLIQTPPDGDMKSVWEELASYYFFMHMIGVHPDMTPAMLGDIIDIAGKAGMNIPGDSYRKEIEYVEFVKSGQIITTDKFFIYE